MSGTHCSGMQCGVSVSLWRSGLVGQNGKLTQPLYVSRCFEGNVLLWYVMCSHVSLSSPSQSLSASLSPSQSLSASLSLSQPLSASLSLSQPLSASLSLSQPLWIQQSLPSACTCMSCAIYTAVQRSALVGSLWRRDALGKMWRKNMFSDIHACD